MTIAKVIGSGLLFFWSLLCMAQPNDLPLTVEYLEDPSRALTLETITSMGSEAWKNSEESVLSFGFTESAYWLRLTIDGPSDQIRKMFLQVAYPALDKLELHSPGPDGTYTLRTTGDTYPFAQRDVVNRNFVFKLDIQGRQTYFIRCETLGSMKIPLQLYDPDHFHAVNEWEAIGLGFFGGVIIAMILYNSFLGLSIRDMNYVYYIGYIGLFMVFNLSLSGVSYQYLWPRNTWLANYSIPLSIFGSSICALQFSRRFLRTDIHNPWLDRVIRGIMTWAIIGVLLLPVLSYKITTQSSTAVALAVNFSLLTAGLILVKRGHRSARFYMIAFAAIWCGMAVKALQTLGLMPVTAFSENGVVIGSMAEVILLSLALGDKIHQEQRAARRKIETLNARLSEKVEEQTSDIRSMLQNIKQGIFTVEMVADVPVLSADFSEHLTEILGEKNLAGRSLMDVVFGRSQLSLDAQQLPKDFTLTAPNGQKKIIEIEWCPVLGPDSRTIHKFLVTLRDVSSYRTLQAHSREQEEELQCISELLNCSNTSFIRFCQLFQDLLSENRRLVSSLNARDGEALKIMFINMHTLKGEARQLHLSRLTSHIHTAEQAFADANKDPRAMLQAKDLLALLDDCDFALQRYIDINEQKLGRSTATHEVSVSRSFLVQVIEKFRQILSLPLAQPLRQELEDTNRKLMDCVFLNAELVLNEAMKHASILARDLQKAQPVIRIDSSRLNLSAAGETLLRKVFLHLIRNSLDHGIESAEERLAKGKPASGTIEVVMDQPDSDSLRIRYRDDGRGINIARLKAIAADLGLLKPDELADPLRIAQVIFEDGISTSKTVTDISGRGMGMGAIKEYVERLGGRIELKLATPEAETQGYLPFELVLLTPLTTMAA
jgi:signal transduction histidine kinase